MRYHEQKMQEINESISSLWTKTYQGTDIDTIMIKSDSEGVTKNGRSYNYRVRLRVRPDRSNRLTPMTLSF